MVFTTESCIDMSRKLSTLENDPEPCQWTRWGRGTRPLGFLVLWQYSTSHRDTKLNKRRIRKKEKEKKKTGIYTSVSQRWSLVETGKSLRGKGKRMEERIVPLTAGPYQMLLSTYKLQCSFQRSVLTIPALSNLSFSHLGLVPEHRRRVVPLKITRTGKFGLTRWLFNLFWVIVAVDFTFYV